MDDCIHLQHVRPGFEDVAICAPWIRGREDVTSSRDEVTCEGCLECMGRAPGQQWASGERIELLANEVLQKMELEDVVCFVRERLIIDYMEDEELFQEDWDFHMGEH